MPRKFKPEPVQTADGSPVDYPAPIKKRRRDEFAPLKLSDDKRAILCMIADAGGRMDYAAIIENWRSRGLSELDYIMSAGGLSPRYIRSLSDDERGPGGEPAVIVTPDGYELLKDLSEDE
jgi:hypothetical protein